MSENIITFAAYFYEISEVPLPIFIKYPYHYFNNYDLSSSISLFKSLWRISDIHTTTRS